MKTSVPTSLCCHGSDNRLSDSGTDVATARPDDAANRMDTAIASGPTTSYSYSPYGNLTNDLDGGAYTLVYDNKNRLIGVGSGVRIYSHIYDADSLKRYEILPTDRTTLIWDGTDYLQGRS